MMAKKVEVRTVDDPSALGVRFALDGAP